MSFDTGYKAIDRLFFLSQGAKHINIVFTGGEPLLVTPLLRELIRYAKHEAHDYDYNLSFIVKTNGSIMNTDVLELAIEHNICFTVSVDGKHGTHDRSRVTVNNDDTQKHVISNIRLLLVNKIECSCSVTIIPQCSIELIENLEYLIDIGLRNFTIGPAYGTVNWGLEQIDNFTDALHRLYNKYKNNTDNVYINPIHNCYIHQNGYFSDSWGCEALHSNIAVLPNGQICGCSALAYLSHEYPFLIIGDVLNGIDENAEKNMLDIIDAGIDPRIECHNCLTKSNCYGGCYAINLSCNREPYTPPPIYCHSIKVLSNLS